MTAAALFTSMLRLTQPQNGLHGSFFSPFLMTPLLNISSVIEIASMAALFNSN
jgi:hypothetical protein